MGGDFVGDSQSDASFNTRPEKAGSNGRIIFTQPSRDPTQFEIKKKLNDSRE